MSKVRNTLTELVDNLIGSAIESNSDEDSIVLKSAVEDLEEYVKFITYTDESVILELARMALSDADIYDTFANKLDLSDEYLKELQGKIEQLTTGVERE